jgi:hypothetical protein
MSTRRRFALAALLAALCTPFAIPAQAGSMQYCFPLNGQRICVPIFGPVPYWPWQRPDPPPDAVFTPIDVSRFTRDLSQLVGGEATHVFVTDSLGKSLLVIDLKEGAAFDLNQQFAR